MAGKGHWPIGLGVGFGCFLLPACTNIFDRYSSVDIRQPAVKAQNTPLMQMAKEEKSPYNPVPEIAAAREMELRRQAENSAECKKENPEPPAIGLGSPTEIKADFHVPAGVEPAPSSKVPEDPPLVAALRSILQKRPEDGLYQLKGFDRANQELLLTLLPLAVRLTETSLTQMSPQEVGVLQESLEQIQAVLQPHAPLTIQKMCFCRRIGGFGIYEPLAPEHGFRRGDRIRIYVELRNFVSKEMKLASGQSKHVIDLVSSAEIRDGAGNKVWPHEIVFQRQGPKADESLTRRQDYFDDYGFFVPDIPPGWYILWIQVEDRGTNPPRTVRGSLDFRMSNLPVQGS